MSKRAKRLCALLLLAALAAGAYYEYQYLTGNFHTVTVGAAYRSAQPDRDQLARYAAKYNIRSVLNLRGKESDKPWYREELAFCEAGGIRHYDITLSALSEPTDRDVAAIIDIFKTAPRPILIHCLGGADRTGFASALWKRVIEGEPASAAARQLSLKYGHMPFGKARAMDRKFRSVVEKSPGNAPAGPAQHLNIQQEKA